MRQLHRVGDGLGDIIALLIADGEGAGPGQPVDARRRQAVTRGEVGILNQGGDLLRPGSRHAFDIGLDLVEVGVQMIARCDADNVMNAGEQGLADMRIERTDAAAKGRRQDLARRLLHLRLVDFARDVQQNRDEAIERIVTREQLDARPVGQVQDAAGDAQQVLFGHLEQFVARIGLEDVLQPLFIIAAGAEAQRLGRVKHALGLTPDQRHFEGRAIIGFGGEQADEANLAGRAAIGPVPFDADIVHVDAAVDARLDIGLGHRHRLGVFQLGQQLLAQHRRFGRAPQHHPARIAQHAETFLKLVQRLFTGIIAVGVAWIGIAPRPQEDKMVGVDPTQESQVLGQDAGIDPQRARCAKAFQGLDLLRQQALHAWEVVHRQMQVGETVVETLEQGFVAFGGQAVDEDQHHRFLERWLAHHLDAPTRGIAVEIDHRVEHRPDRGALIDQLAHHGFDDERRIRLDDFDDIVTRRLTGGGQQGLDPAQSLGRRALIAIGPESGNGGIDVGDIEAGQFVRVEIVEDLPQKDLFRRVQRIAGCGSLVFDEALGEGVMQGRRGLRRHGAGDEFVHRESCLFLTPYAKKCLSSEKGCPLFGARPGTPRTGGLFYLYGAAFGRS